MFSELERCCGSNWWLRSANNTNNAANVNNNGNSNNNNVNNSNAVALGSSHGRQSNHLVKSVHIGEKEKTSIAKGWNSLRVNSVPDRSGRTLLAWRCLMVICRFMPSDLMQLYVIIRELYRRSFKKDKA